MKQTARTVRLFSIVLTGVLLIHAVSALPFYAIISRELESGPAGYPGYLYMAARLMRLTLCIALALPVRKRLGAAGGAESGRICRFLLAALVLVTLLCMNGWGEKFYLAVSYRAGIYGPENAPLFLAVLWEQVFSVDLLYSALIGALTAAVPVRPRRRA